MPSGGGLDAGALPLLPAQDRSIMAAAAARRLRSPATRGKPIRCVTFRRIMIRSIAEIAAQSEDAGGAPPIATGG